MTGTVYFIRAGEGGPVKIGYCTDTDERMNNLQTAHYDTLHLIRAVPGNRAKEKWLHRHFKDLRLRGEWFTFDPSMLTVEPPEVETTPRDAVTFDSNGLPNDILEYVVQRLQDTDERQKDIAEKVGIPKTTVQRIASRYTTNPLFVHVDKLCRYFLESA